jgi:ubiquinone/menaquinone biosynthesis C-methylase UbiE
MKKNIEIPPERYNKRYLLSKNVEGYGEYLNETLSSIKTKQLTMLKLHKDLKILDVGLGRGELLRECSKIGAIGTGIDYSPDAVLIAKKTMSKFHNSKVLRADSRNLPFANNVFDRVFCGDVIEHMNFDDAVKSVKEMKRVLKKGGFALIHTSPNTVFIHVVYPFLKIFLKILYPKIYRGMEMTMKVRHKVHIDEYNYFSLLFLAKKSGLKKYKVWIEDDVLRSGGHRHTQTLHDGWVGGIIKRIQKIWLFRFFFGNDLYLKFK